MKQVKIGIIMNMVIIPSLIFVVLIIFSSCENNESKKKIGDFVLTKKLSKAKLVEREYKTKTNSSIKVNYYKNFIVITKFDSSTKLVEIDSIKGDSIYIYNKNNFQIGKGKIEFKEKDDMIGIIGFISFPVKNENLSRTYYYNSFLKYGDNFNPDQVIEIRMDNLLINKANSNYYMIFKSKIPNSFTLVYNSFQLDNSLNLKFNRKTSSLNIYDKDLIKIDSIELIDGRNTIENNTIENKKAKLIEIETQYFYNDKKISTKTMLFDKSFNWK